MTFSEMPKNVQKKILSFQKDEVTSTLVYRKMAALLSDSGNAKIILDIADDEERHAQRWEGLTGKKIKADKWKVFSFSFISRVLGLTFAVKQLEKAESEAQGGYSEIEQWVPGVKEMIEDEHRHEKHMISLIDEERLRYAGSVVLGLNDALVELTGALAGFTFAFQNTRLIAMTGLITGISAAFSMASSEYLSQRSEGDGSVSPAKSAMYTGIAYIITVVLLVLPFFLTANFILALGLTLAIVVLIILSFNYYLCTAKDLPFRRHFLEMLSMSLGVTVLSFGVGIAVKHFLGIEI